MRLLGMLLSILSLAAGAFYVWIFYVMTFEEINPRYLFVVEPKEGYAYWNRIKFWENLRAFCVGASIATVGAVLPISALIRTSRLSRPRPILDGMIMAVSLVYVGLCSYMLLQIGEGPFHPTLLAPAGILGGAIFAIFALWTRISFGQLPQRS